jgi:hypothetical protein
LKKLLFKIKIKEETIMPPKVETSFSCSKCNKKYSSLEEAMKCEKLEIEEITLPSGTFVEIDVDTMNSDQYSSLDAATSKYFHSRPLPILAMITDLLGRGWDTVHLEYANHTPHHGKERHAYLSFPGSYHNVSFYDKRSWSQFGHLLPWQIKKVLMNCRVLSEKTFG